MANFEDLINRWIRGWQASRDLPAPEVTDDAIRIHCRQPGREFEVFPLRFDEDPESVRRLAAEVLAAEEPTWLTVTTRDSAKACGVVEAAGLQVHLRSETLMATDLTRHPRRDLDPAFTSEVGVEGSDIEVVIRDGAGEIAARGHMGLVDGDGIADRILTMPDFRRRGLGAVVMGMLAAEAVARGARDGLLIASEEGRRLYTQLGWERIADVVIAQRPVQ
jgi:GNAT superfamily N-acetyltransferase